MTETTYASQRIAKPFFLTAAVLFATQISYGLLIATQQVDPYLLRGVANFNINRAVHVNLAILWVLTGLFGAILYIAPALAKRELPQKWLARVLLVAIWAIAGWMVVSLPLGQSGMAGWALGQPWLQQGLEYLELGRIGGVAIAVGLAIVAYLTLRALPPMREWNELHWGLAIGVSALGVMWLFGLFFVPALDLQEYFRWFVVHYWVEGAFEIVYTTVVGFLLYAFFGADLRRVGVAVFWGVLLVALAGLIGNGHHYFWVGTPAIWQLWGSIFSALEPLPIFLVVWHVASGPEDGQPQRTSTSEQASAGPEGAGDARATVAITRTRTGNDPAFAFVFGSAILYLVGAGILGFTQTFALTNVWEHGTWVTPAHAHLALFGTFGMLVLGAAYAIVPRLKGIARPDEHLARGAFWTILVGIVLMTTIAFAFGGTAQVYVYRVLGLDWFRFEVRPALQVFRVLLLLFGSVFAFGVALVVYDLFTLKPASEAGPSSTSRWWRSPVRTGEIAAWLLILVVIGAVLTGALLANNLAEVQMGDPTLPFTLALIGYPSLGLVTLALCIRLMRSKTGREVRGGELPPQVL